MSMPTNLAPVPPAAAPTSTVTRGGPEWDAARDAYDNAADEAERKRHVSAALANMAGKHPNATVIPKPAAATTAAAGSDPKPA